MYKFPSLLLFCLFFFFSSYINISSQVNTGNMILNPGFESGLGENPEGWTKVAFSDENYQHHPLTYQLGITTDNPHSGNAAYKIGRVWAQQWIRVGVIADQEFSISPAKKYYLNFWYRTSGIDEYTLPFAVRFEVRRNNHNSLRYERNLSTSAGWREAHLILKNLPDDAYGVQVSVAMRIRTKGDLIVDDFIFREADSADIAVYEEWRRQPLPEPVGFAGNVNITGNGYFQVAQGDNRWWFIDPAGNAKWAIGVLAEYPGSTGNGSPALYDWARANYPDRISYCRMQFGLLKEWGFNAYSSWTGSEFADITGERYDSGESYFPVYYVLSLSGRGDKDYYARDRSGNMKGPGHAFPDPFNPQWRQDARTRAESKIPLYKDKPWFAGWFVDSEADFNDLFRYVWADYSGAEFIDFLEEKYVTIDSLNNTWTSSFGTYNYISFNTIANGKPEPADWDDPLYADFTAFERIMMNEYINFTYGLIKELDPSHLVLSNSINLGPMPSLHRTIDLWSKYDVVCMNIYPQNVMFGFAPGEIELMEKLYRGTGKPVLIGEWSVPAVDSDLYSLEDDPQDRPLDWSWPKVFMTQAERGEAYKTCMRQLASLDFMLGAGWFKTLDVDSPTRRANRGLINTKHEPYAGLVSAIKETNNYINKRLILSVAGKSAVPGNSHLKQNYPNPFNPYTTIEYDLAKKGNVTIKIYNILGQEVETLINKIQQPGSYRIKWKPKNLSSGIYLYSLKAGNYTETKKLLLLK